MLRTKYRCVQSPNMSVDVAKCWENVHKFTQYTHFLSVTRNDLSWLNNLLMVMFPLIRMSSYAKNKPQMCSVTQHYFTLRQMWGKFSQFHPSTLTFCLLQKNDMSLLNNLFMVSFNSFRCPLMLTTNYRCVPSPNITLDALCGENLHWTKYTVCLLQYLLLKTCSVFLLCFEAYCHWTA